MSQHKNLSSRSMVEFGPDDVLVARLAAVRTIIDTDDVLVLLPHLTERGAQASLRLLREAGLVEAMPFLGLRAPRRIQYKWSGYSPQFSTAFGDGH